MTEITFSKSGEQYISNPIFGSGNSLLKYQIGYKNAGARVIFEHSFSPTKGYQIFIDKVAPAMPDYLVGTQFVPNGVYVRIRTNVEPDEAEIDFENGEENKEPPLNKKVVASLPDVSEAEENVIYLVKNGSSENNNLYDEYLLVNGKFELIGQEEEFVTDKDVDAIFGKDEEDVSGGTVTKVVEELPDPYDAKPNTIYVIKNSGMDADNSHDEYILVDGKLEKIGSEVPVVEDDEIEGLFK